MTRWPGGASIRFAWLEVRTRSCWLWTMSHLLIHHWATRSASLCSWRARDIFHEHPFLYLQTENAFSSWPPNLTETESEWQQSQRYEECLGTQRSVPRVHKITRHPRELQHRYLWGDSEATPDSLESNWSLIEMIFWANIGDISSSWTTLFSPSGWLGMAKETSLWDVRQHQPQDQQRVWTGRTQCKHINACKPLASWCFVVKQSRSHRWKTCATRILTLSWASFMTVVCLPLWPSSAPEAVWRTCCKTMTWSWTGCSSHLCSWIWLRLAWTEGRMRKLSKRFN